MKTESFNLSKNIISLLEKEGITIATPIQKKIIPAVMQGRDVLAQSETGSGKTISFAIPIIEKIQPADNLCALILVPTRELCTQVTEEFIKFSHGKRLGITAVYGGVSIENQIRKIKKTNIIVATPGRLIDLLDRGIIHLNKIKFLVFDEADRMLDMGFINDIEKILRYMSQKMQTMLFSATVSKEITELSKKYLFNPVKVILESTVDPGFLHQTYYQTTPEKKLPLLIHLLKKERDLSLVFCNRKHITSKLADKLTRFGILAKCLHGDMSQSQRERVTIDFKNKKFKILIATDVASRGLHIEDISHVYNYEIPKDVDSYTHRIGRTARAGKKGDAISLVTNGEEQKFFKQILFNYGGIIQLKTVNNDSLNVEENEVKSDFRKKEKGRFKESRPDGKEKDRFREKRPDRNEKERFREKRRDKKEKERYRSDRPEKKDRNKSFNENKKWQKKDKRNTGQNDWEELISLYDDVKKNENSSKESNYVSERENKSNHRRKNKPGFFERGKSMFHRKHSGKKR